MIAPAGTVVGIYYDGVHVMAEGEALRTPTGRTYLVVANRIQVTGKHRRRQHLRCLVVDSVDPGTAVFPLHWYRRRRRG